MITVNFFFICLIDSNKEKVLVFSLFFSQNYRVTDTTSAQARKGKDIQGIPWHSLSITRKQYRQTRLEQYKNYENVQNSGEASEKAWCFGNVQLSYLNLIFLLVKFSTCYFPV